MWKRTWTWAEAQVREHPEHWNLWTHKQDGSRGQLGPAPGCAGPRGAANAETWPTRAWSRAKALASPCSRLHSATSMLCDTGAQREDSRSRAVGLETRAAQRLGGCERQDENSRVLTPNQGFFKCRVKRVKGFKCNSSHSISPRDRDGNPQTDTVGVSKRCRPNARVTLKFAC